MLGRLNESWQSASKPTTNCCQNQTLISQNSLPCKSACLFWDTQIFLFPVFFNLRLHCPDRFSDNAAHDIVESFLSSCRSLALGIVVDQYGYYR